jgi:hypothetical protein
VLTFAGDPGFANGVLGAIVVGALVKGREAYDGSSGMGAKFWCASKCPSVQCRS